MATFDDEIIERCVTCERCGGLGTYNWNVAAGDFTYRCDCTVPLKLRGIHTAPDGPVFHCAIDRSKFRSSRCRFRAKGNHRLPTVFRGVDPQTMFRVVWKADDLYILWILDGSPSRYWIVRIEEHVDCFEVITQAVAPSFEAAYELAFDRPFPRPASALEGGEPL